MTTLKCCCKIIGSNLDLEKEVKNGRGLIEKHRMSYYHKHYIIFVENVVRNQIYLMIWRKRS